METINLLNTVCRVLERMRVPYAVVGSMASMYFGEARFTNDVDVVADLPAGLVAEFISAFPGDRYYLSEDAVQWAIQHRSQFNIIDTETGLKCDVILPKDDPLDIEQLATAKPQEIAPRIFARYASPEATILKKMLAYEEGGSEKHLRDIASMLKVNSTPIDRDYIANWASRLGVATIWQTILDRLPHPNV